MAPLSIAVRNGHQSVVELLIKTAAVGVNSTCITGQPPIFWAIAAGYHSISRMLIEAGANPHIADEFGNTAYSVAMQTGHNDLLQILSQSEHRSRVFSARINSI